MNNVPERSEIGIWCYHNASTGTWILYFSLAKSHVPKYPSINLLVKSIYVYAVSSWLLRLKIATVMERNLPYSSINLRAFSKKDGDPSTSSRASKIGLPTTIDFTVCLSFTNNKLLTSIPEMMIDHLMHVKVSSWIYTLMAGQSFMNDSFARLKSHKNSCRLILVVVLVTTGTIFISGTSLMEVCSWARSYTVLQSHQPRWTGHSWRYHSAPVQEQHLVPELKHFQGQSSIHTNPPMFLPGIMNRMTID